MKKKVLFIKKATIGCSSISLPRQKRISMNPVDVKKLCYVSKQINDYLRIALQFDKENEIASEIINKRCSS